MATQPDKTCDNCGGRATLSCAVCTRRMCDDCYHCGSMGKVCGLCLDREEESYQESAEAEKKPRKK